MKPNVIIALLVGGVVGFAVGRMASGTGGSAGAPGVVAMAPTAAAPRAAPGPGGGDQTVFKVPIDGSPTKGPNNALITLVEFSDYQCPFCSRGHNTVKEMEKEYEGKIRVVMKQNPLSFHPNAKPAAVAAMAAGEQGKYWEFHDKLFANQQALDADTFERYAKELGLNIDKWKTDLKASKFNDVIARDQALAGQLGASGTPCFFINGRKLSGAQPAPAFKALIDEELAKAQALVSAGTRPEDIYAAVLEKGVTQAPAAPQQAAAPAAAPAIRKIDVPADSPAKGAKVAKVNIVLWSDFQCPFCSRVVPTMKQIEETYGKEVKMVFRHQPLPFHNNAKIAAEASMAANEQGKFWPMHDKMFANQGALDRQALEGYAKEIGLDMGKFKNALDTNKFAARVEADSAAGNAVGANGTPTFFINGREFVGAQPFEAFKPIIDEEIAKANKLIASGTKAEDVYAKLQEEAGKAAPVDPHAGHNHPPGQGHGEAPAAPPTIANIDIATAAVKGPKNAPVTLVVFSDFQCPFCSRVVPTLHDLEKQYGNKLKIAFKHQPLPFHPNARPAAAASMAANEQGKFWEMHDKLFANQGALDRQSLEKYAQEVGLDMGKFKAAMDGNKYDALITKDSNEGTAVGANGTPTFFINGRQLVGAQPIDQFKAIIDDELKKKGGK